MREIESVALHPIVHRARGVRDYRAEDSKRILRVYDLLTGDFQVPDRWVLRAKELVGD